jgi:hypothetical protein
VTSECVCVDVWVCFQDIAYVFSGYAPLSVRLVSQLVH